MKPGNFLMIMRLLSAFVVFIWGVEQSHAQNLSAPGQFKIMERINQADSPAAKQDLGASVAAHDSEGSLAVAPPTGQTPPTKNIIQGRRVL